MNMRPTKKMIPLEKGDVVVAMHVMCADHAAERYVFVTKQGRMYESEYSYSHGPNQNLGGFSTMEIERFE